MGDGEVKNGAVGVREYSATINNIDRRLTSIEASLNTLVTQRRCDVHELTIHDTKDMAEKAYNKIPEIESNTKFRQQFTLTKMLGALAILSGIAVSMTKIFDFLVKFIKG